MVCCSGKSGKGWFSLLGEKIIEVNPEGLAQGRRSPEIHIDPPF